MIFAVVWENFNTLLTIIRMIHRAPSLAIVGQKNILRSERQQLATVGVERMAFKIHFWRGRDFVAVFPVEHKQTLFFCADIELAVKPFQTPQIVMNPSLDDGKSGSGLDI